MRNKRAYVTIAIVFFLLVWIWTHQIQLNLGNADLTSGWVLFGILVFLALFSARKRLPFLPLAPSSRWFLLHSVGGVLAISLFWLHIGKLWPTGLYSQILTMLFYTVTLSGILGLLIEKAYPNLLTRSGVECIYERIPAEIAEIREKAEDVVLECTRETGNDTLAQHYLETMRWFFQRPRFFINHSVGGDNARHWVDQQCSILERYLNEKEKKYLQRIFNLADTKRKIDFHYTAQTILKGWLLIHVPLAAAVMTLVLWHVLIIQVYFV